MCLMDFHSLHCSGAHSSEKKRKLTNLPNIRDKIRFVNDLFKSVGERQRAIQRVQTLADVSRSALYAFVVYKAISV